MHEITARPRDDAAADEQQAARREILTFDGTISRNADAT